ncbi:MAG: hypothetical protein GAK28_00583 [Luteibacter sp.]|uniref:DUF2303 family protein n=1 Tax=Luteibacter sp. TaxID=1886636 RepID=UPI00137DD1CC|nr:DUF2303 family protein [Luteibacter sp.]KAF1008951.1 MAG: hypothetical protein GAK28_00583 [Luteibacter sp.]
MDSSAIETIQSTAVKAEQPHNLGTPTPALFHDGKIISIEHLQQGRSRFRGLYSTNSIDAFATYAKAHPGGEGFVDIDTMRASIYFNLGSPEEPGHGDWRATLTLSPTAEYAALLNIEGKKLDQKAIVEWLEDWGAYVVALDKDMQAIKPAKAIGAIRNISIKATSESNHQEKDFGARRSSVEDIEASAEDGIPYAIGFTAVTYDGLAQRSFTLRLSVLTAGDKPLIVLRPIGLDSAKEAIAKEFQKVLEDRIANAASLVLGSFNPLQ